MAISKTDAPLPWFPFYPADFWLDENVQAMDDSEIVAYLRLLSICWQKGSIPDNIAVIGGICKMDAPAMAQAWHRLCPCFVESEHEEGRLENPRMTLERDAAFARSGRQSDKGKQGAMKRWHGHGAGNAQAMPGDSYLQSQLQLELQKKQKEEEGGKPPARRRAPVFSVPDSDFPESIRTPDVIAAWRDFEQHRREIKKPMTPTAARQALANMADWSPARAAGAIRHTTAKGWQGIREPDAEIQGRGQASLEKRRALGAPLPPPSPEEQAATDAFIAEMKTRTAAIKAERLRKHTTAVNPRHSGDIDECEICRQWRMEEKPEDYPGGRDDHPRA